MILLSFNAVVAEVGARRAAKTRRIDFREERRDGREELRLTPPKLRLARSDVPIALSMHQD